MTPCPKGSQDPCQKGQGPLPKGFTAPQTLAKRVKDPCQKGSQHHRPKGFYRTLAKRVHSTTDPCQKGQGPLRKGFTAPQTLAKRVHRTLAKKVHSTTDPCQKGQRPLPKGPRTLAKRVMKPLTKRQCTAFLDKRENTLVKRVKFQNLVQCFGFLTLD